jgi:hypothetical protein
MYLADLLNGHSLFQSVSGLEAEPKENSEIPDFLFRATSALLHLERVQLLHRACLEEYGMFADELDVKRQRIVLGSPNVVRLVNEIPPMLNTLRIMQDMTLPLCARSGDMRCSVSSSLNDAVCGLHRYPFPERVKALTLQYWQRSGNLLKDYRDLDQHYRTIVNHVLLEVRPCPRLLILLPDNPAARREADFTFNEERNALEYLPRCFRELHDWVEAIARELGSRPVPLQTCVRMSQLGHLAPPTGGVLALIVEHIVGEDGSHQVKGIDISQLMDCRLSVRQMFRKIVPIRESERNNEGCQDI